MGTNSSKNQKEHQSDDTPKAKSGFFAVFFRKKSKTTASSEELQSVQAGEKEPEKTEPKKAESKKSEPDTLPDDDIDQENALLGYKAVARRMAVSAQPPEKASEAPSNPVELDIVFQVPRSKVIVNPFDFDTKSKYKVVEKTVKAVDTDYAVKNILYELFEPKKEARRSWKKA